MGIIQKIVSSAHIAIATEAEDITNQIDDDVNNIFGNSDDSDSDKQDSQNTDYLDNDNIDNDWSTTSDENMQQEENNDLNNNGLDDTQNSDGENNEDNEFMQDQKNDVTEIKNKQILHERMMFLYNILTDNLNLLSAYSPESNNPEIVMIINNIKSNLADCQSISHRIMTTEFEDKSYNELMRKYISLKRVYDLSIEMLERVFQNIRERKAPTLKKLGKK